MDRGIVTITIVTNERFEFASEILALDPVDHVAILHVRAKCNSPT